MKKVILFIMLALLFFLPSNIPCLAEPLPARFIEIVRSLESYAIENRIELEKGESIKDVVTLGYLNAINRLNAPFGSLDHRIKREAIEWLSILCWFPIVPPEKKKEAEKDLKKIRRALALNSYERTLASISLLPGFAVSSIGEILPSNQMFEKYPYSAKGKELQYYFDKKKYSSDNIIKELLKDKIDYKDLIASEWTEKYLK
jgi:hypothetical protein